MTIRARIFAAALAAGVLAGQQSAPVFRAGTKLVEVTVSVLDKKGNAVTGLDTADFTVLDEGKPRPVAFFRFDGGSMASPGASGAATPSPAPKLPPGVFSNRLEAEKNAPRNVTALVLDTINTPPQQSVMARAQMMRYLRALAPKTQVAVFLMGSELRILHDFTDDSEALRARLAKATLAMPSTNVTDYTQSILEAEAFVDMFAGNPVAQKAAEDMMRNSLEVESMANSAARRRRMELSLAAMEALGSHLAGIPGRKSVVWIGSGFSMVSISGSMGMGPRGSAESFESMVRQTAQKLAQQGIILYIVDSAGISVAPDQTAASRGALPVRGRGRFEPQMDTEAINNDPKPAMGLMADVTGGRYLYNTNDLTAGFKQAVADMQGSYTLGFYLQGDPDDKWHKLKVRVKRPGVNVLHRAGYLSSFAPEPSAEWTPATWTSVFSNPVSSTVIPLTVRCQRTGSGDLALAIWMDVNALQFRPEGDTLKADLEIGFSDRAADGQLRAGHSTLTASVPAAKWDEARKQGIILQRQWKAGDDAVMLRVILRDVRGGQYGSLDIPLKQVQ